jgi:hypothetical protein
MVYSSYISNGVVILDKLINDLKAKLPLKKKVSEEEIEEAADSSNEDSDLTDSSIDSDKTDMTDLSELEGFESNDKPQTFIDKIKSKIIPPKQSSKKSDEGDKTKTADGKKKVNPVIVVVVIVGLGIWLIPDEEEPVPEVPVASSYKKPNRKRKPKTEQASPEGQVNAETQTPPSEVAPAPDASVTSAEVPSTEPAVVEPAVVEPAVVEPAVVESTVAEPTVTEPTVAEPTVAEPTVEEPTDTGPVITESTPEEPSPTPDVSVDNTSGESSSSTDSVEGQTAQTPSETDVTDKILEDLEKQVKKEQPKEVQKEYVSPPDYEYKGRGLVYNCRGKHWACVDAPSYKSCEDNFSSVGYLKKNKECYPFNVYDTTKGCELMQNRVVSSNAKTDFCK